MTRYRHGEKVIEVITGLGGDCWMTGWRSAYGGTHRLKSKFLPVRTDPEQAQRDLDAWAKRKGLETAE